MITQKIQLKIIPGGNMPVIHVNQHDTGTGRLKFESSQIISGSTGIIQGTTPGGTFSHSVSISAGQATSDLYADMTEYAGDVRAQLVLTKNGNRAGSQVFIIRVQRAAQ